MLSLKQWRRAKGISQETVAAAIGIHVNTYQSWEIDSDKIPLGKAMKIAEVIGVPFDQIDFLLEKSTKNEEST